MLRPLQCALVAVTLLHASVSFADVMLDGHSATPETIALIADGDAVRIAPAALRHVEDAHRVLLQGKRLGWAVSSRARE